jgi:hypothetical protein
VSNSSAYLSTDTIITNDSSNDYYYNILLNTGHSAKSVQSDSVYGYFQHIVISNITITVINTNTITIDTTGDPVLLQQVTSLLVGSHLKFSNTPGNAYDGLYYLTSSISGPSPPNVYTLQFGTTYIRNGVKYTTPDPFSPLPGSPIVVSILVNQFILQQLSVLDFTDVIDGFGENARFLQFFGQSYYEVNKLINFNK